MKDERAENIANIALSLRVMAAAHFVLTIVGGVACIVYIFTKTK